MSFYRLGIFFFGSSARCTRNLFPFRFPVATHAQCFALYTNQSLFVDLKGKKSSDEKQRFVRRSGTREEEGSFPLRSQQLSRLEGRLGSEGRNSRCSPTSSSSSSSVLRFCRYVLPVSTTIPQLLTQIKIFFHHGRFPSAAVTLSISTSIVRRPVLLLSFFFLFSFFVSASHSPRLSSRNPTIARATVADEAVTSQFNLFLRSPDEHIPFFPIVNSSPVGRGSSLDTR